jgi:hypothetical protein
VLSDCDEHPAIPRLWGGRPAVGRQQAYSPLLRWQIRAAARGISQPSCSNVLPSLLVRYPTIAVGTVHPCTAAGMRRMVRMQHSSGHRHLPGDHHGSRLPLMLLALTAIAALCLALRPASVPLASAAGSNSCAGTNACR